MQRLLDEQPVRLFAYPVLTVVLGMMVIKGWLDGDMANVIVGIFAVALGVPATEAVHAAVTPTTKTGELISTAVSEVFNAAKPEIEKRLGGDAEQITSQIQLSLMNFLGRHHKNDK